MGSQAGNIFVHSGKPKTTKKIIKFTKDGRRIALRKTASAGAGKRE